MADFLCSLQWVHRFSFQKCSSPLINDCTCRVAKYATPKYDGRSSGCATPKILGIFGCFGILIILNHRHLKYSKCEERLSLNSLYLPKNRTSKRNSIVTNALLEVLSQERRLDVDTTLRHTLSQTVITPVFSSRGPFTFPKNHFVSPKRPMFPLPFLY